MGNNTQNFVEIDENRLDRECIRLPSDYLKAANQSSEAKRDLTEAESELSVVEAELSKAIRAKPEAYGIEKVTEAAISAAILQRKAYKAALEKVHEARYTADMAQNLVWAMEHKKRALTLLVDLHGLGYFAQARVSSEGRDAVDKFLARRKKGRGQED